MKIRTASVFPLFLVFASELMKPTYLHIISFDTPYPPNYGGVIDVFYKVKALHKIGVKVILHCFSYGREQSSILDEFTEKSYYYKRKTNIFKMWGKTPYIVSSRNSRSLLKNLLKDDHPILFEGLHCCFFLNKKSLKDRVKIVRTHNVEHDYYKLLAEQTTHFLRKRYYLNAAKKLKDFQPILAHANHITAISRKDHKYFEHHFNHVSLLPPFHPCDEVTSKEGLGKYSLFHGNLEVEENITAAKYLIATYKVYPNMKLKIAGKNPSQALVDMVQKYRNITIVSSPSAEMMDELIHNAQIILLPTFQATGIKLKLIESLYKGRHIIANENMLIGTGLSELCHIANDSSDLIYKAKDLLKVPFGKSEIDNRALALLVDYSNDKNAAFLKDLLS